MADAPTHFFKFIRSSFHLNLSIPRSFLVNLNIGSFSKAILRRGGHEWPVEITDGGFSGDGWRKCVTENGVKEFDFMVFKHQGNMVFDFLVFDPSLCERQFPNPPANMEVEDHRESEPQPEITPYNMKSSRLASVPMELARSNALITNNHPYFTSTIPSYTIKKSYLHLPIDFVRSNGLKIGKMILRDNKSRSWEVLLKKTSRTRFYLGCSFRAFQAANELKEGDAYTFELVENKKNKPPVVNFSCIHGKSCMMKEEEDDDQPRTYFVNKLKSYSTRKSHLYLPNGFVNTNGLCNIEEIILRNGEDERSWIVEFKNYMNKYFYIGRGWKDFCVANGLKEGDGFKLEIVDNIEEKVAMNFYVLKDPPRLL